MAESDPKFMDAQNRMLRKRIEEYEEETRKEKDKTRMMLKLINAKNDQLEKSFEELAEAHAKLKKGYNQTVRYYLNTVTAMANAMESKIPHFQGHSAEVSRLLHAFGTAIGLPADELEALKMSGLLHDFGNIGVPEKVLEKPGPLTKEERGLVQKHPALAALILEPIGIVTRVASDIEGHHENWDGSGYPKGLSGEEINRGARLVALAEVYVALTSDRPWRKALPKPKAIKTMEGETGTKFDPDITPIFLQFVADRSE
jgi:HD-GYP domain-containing protein (c-di-GMP phosphodiesterase class II)